jgi:glycosyltransferase involved in cell wall biosynthesis
VNGPGTPGTIAAVVPTYNRRDRLARMVEILARPDDLDEIVIVVDGSRDGSIELLEELAASEPRLRPLWTENGGPIAALMAGADTASSDVVVNLDDDVIPEPGLFEGHLRHHRERDGLVVTGYAYMPPEGWRPGGFIREAFRRNYEAQCERWERDPTTVLTELWTPNVSFRRADLLRVSAENPVGFGGGAWYYHSDWDLGVRCARLGLEGRFDRGLRAEHEFERGFAGFVSDARSSGRGKVLMEQLHPELAGHGEIRSEERAPIRALLPLARGPGWAATAVSTLLTGAIRLAGALRSPGAEMRLAGVLKRFEQERGRVEAIREGIRAEPPDR